MSFYRVSNNSVSALKPEPEKIYIRIRVCLAILPKISYILPLNAQNPSFKRISNFSTYYEAKIKSY